MEMEKKYGIDYGVKIDWSAYHKVMRILCRIPIINLFFTEKFDVHVTVMTKHGPIYGTFAKLRFPKSKRIGAYHIISSLDDGDYYDGRDFKNVLVTLRRRGCEIGCTSHPLPRWTDILTWQKYYVRKCGYATPIDLGDRMKG